jgi:hypothetical protein
MEKRREKRIAVACVTNFMDFANFIANGNRDVADMKFILAKSFF